MTLRGFGSLDLGFCFLDFLVNFEVFGVFMVELRREKKKYLWREGKGRF